MSKKTDRERVTDAIAEFPAEFSLRAFQDGRFRLSVEKSYVSGGDIVLVTQRYFEANESSYMPINTAGWLDFASGSPCELRREYVERR